MLKSIITVTLIVNQLAAVEGPYREELGYQAVHRGRISAAQAHLWAAPALRDREFLILKPASGRDVYLRFIEDAAAEVPAAGTSHGWNALELLASDPDALARRFEDGPFRTVGPPRNLGPGPTAPRAMQAIGPAGELLYFTRVPVPMLAGIPMSPAAAPVDRIFIMVLGGPSLPELRDYYGSRLGLPVGETARWQITTLSRALGLPLDTVYPLAVAPLPRDFLVELDEYPAVAAPRPVRAGALPGGIAMVTFGVADLDRLALDWRAPPSRIAEFPYSGQRAAATVGPAGEWLELVEIAGLASDPD